MSNLATIDVLPIEHEHLSAAEFKALLRDNPGIIKESRFVPGALGGKSFGTFSVTYNRPLYKASQNFHKKMR